MNNNEEAINEVVNETEVVNANNEEIRSDDLIHRIAEIERFFKAGIDPNEVSTLLNVPPQFVISIYESLAQKRDAAALRAKRFYTTTNLSHAERKIKRKRQRHARKINRNRLKRG